MCQEHAPRTCKHRVGRIVTVALFLISFLFAGCTLPVKNYRFGEEVIRGLPNEFKLESDEARRIALSNRMLLDEHYAVERQFYRSTRKSGRIHPARCIALSGGGSRSAAFSLGVLSWLLDDGSLSTVDVISSVSGGGYAAFFHLANSIAGKHPVNIYAREAPYLQNVAERPLLDLFWKLWSAITTPICQPLELLSRLGALPTSTCGASNYYVALASIYADEAKGTWYSKSVGSLLPEIALGEIPLPIFNAAVSYGSARECDRKSPETYAHPRTGTFEITPLRTGSEYLGFNSRLQNRFSVAQAVAISGAATDRPNGPLCRLQSLFGYKTGTNIPRYVSTVGGVPNEKSIYLADGAFAENLGLYPLIKRQCDDIVVVDAGFDPELGYPDLVRLRKALQEDDIHVASSGLDTEIRRSDEHCGSLQQNGAADNDAPCFRARSAIELVHEGTIGPFPLTLEEGVVIEHHLNLTYVKLGIPQGREWPEFPKYVRKRSEKQAPACDAKGACGFPHEWTRDQNFSEDQFWAYFELGRYLAEARNVSFSHRAESSRATHFSQILAAGSSR